jgi:hypothetical protein
VSGYGQLLLTLAGFALTSIFGVRFVFWGFSNWSRLHGPGVDPYEALEEWWVQVRWALLGVGVFMVALLWAFCSSLGILASARKAEPHKQPPRLA